MVKAIFIDIHGVILRHDLPKILNTIESKYSLKKGNFWEVFHGKPHYFLFSEGKMTGSKYWSLVCKKLGKKLDKGWIVRSIFSRKDIDKKLVLFLRKLKKKYKIITYSNLPKSFMELLLSYGLRNLFDVALCSADTGVRKPQPEAYMILARKIDLPPEDILYIDDQETNIKMGKSLGFKVLQFTSVGQLQRELLRQ